MSNADTLIVGAGLAGLATALHLKQNGQNVKILEATSRAGGRIKTDLIDGFRLDRGFQVLLTAYPEAQDILDYDALDLRKFAPGSLIVNEKGKHHIGDPLRDFGMLLPTLASGIGSFGDKLKMLSLKRRLMNKTLTEIFEGKDQASSQILSDAGFGEGMIQDFFTPFFRGIFLESDLETSGKMFEFVFKMFSEGDATIPAAGMESIPQQLADRIGKDAFCYNTRIAQIDGQKLTSTKGEVFEAENIVLAMEGWSPLMGEQYPAHTPSSTASVTCVYLSTPRPPYREPLLCLNAGKEARVNNLAVLSNLSSRYAPSGMALLSVSILGDVQENDEQLMAIIRSEMRPHFGAEVEKWAHIHTYKIPHALPSQIKVKDKLLKEEINLRKGLFRAGDFLMNGSIQAALKSGRLAARAVLESRA